MLARIVFVVITLAVLAALVVLAWPQAFGLEHTLGVAQLVAFRAALAAAAVVLAVLLLLGMIVARRTRAFFGLLAVIFLVFAGSNVAILGSRGFVAGSGHAGSAAAPAEGAVTVLSWNTLGGAVGAPEIASLALRLGADVITLPETPEATATAVAALMTASGVPVWSHTASHGEFPGQSTSILVSNALGEYAVNDTFGDTGSLPSIVASPVSGDGPTLAAVHPVAPVPDDLSQWQGDLDWLTRLCGTPNLIAAGDFNATLDHLTNLADCDDAALAAGTAAVGTWPTWLPPLVGTPIDHVVSTSGWKVVSAEVVVTEDEAGSDHRPITATLERE